MKARSLFLRSRTQKHEACSRSLGSTACGSTKHANLETEAGCSFDARNLGSATLQESDVVLSNVISLVHRLN
jgi:hypothetical protein